MVGIEVFADHYISLLHLIDFSFHESFSLSTLIAFVLSGCRKDSDPVVFENPVVEITSFEQVGECEDLYIHFDLTIEADAGIDSLAAFLVIDDDSVFLNAYRFFWHAGLQDSMNYGNMVNAPGLIVNIFEWEAFEVYQEAGSKLFVVSVVDRQGQVHSDYEAIDYDADNHCCSNVETRSLRLYETNETSGSYYHIFEDTIYDQHAVETPWGSSGYYRNFDLVFYSSNDSLYLLSPYSAFEFFKSDNVFSFLMNWEHPYSDDLEVFFNEINMDDLDRDWKNCPDFHGLSGSHHPFEKAIYPVEVGVYYFENNRSSGSYIIDVFHVDQDQNGWYIDMDIYAESTIRLSTIDYSPTKMKGAQ